MIRSFKSELDCGSRFINKSPFSFQKADNYFITFWQMVSYFLRQLYQKLKEETGEKIILSSLFTLIFSSYNDYISSGALISSKSRADLSTSLTA